MSEQRRSASSSYQPRSIWRKRVKREWKPLEDRSCTDLPWFLLFMLFCGGMGAICGYTIVTGGAARLVFGYDSYGNTCGQTNEAIEGVRLSGLDHRDRKYVFFLDPCNLDIIQRKIKSMALCVSQCPTEEMKTYEDLRRFAMWNMLSMILMVIIRYISAVLVWILTVLVVLGSLGGTSFLWWLYIDHRLTMNETLATDLKEATETNGETVASKDHMRGLLVYATSATVFTVILLLLMLFMRKRVALTIALFHVAGKVFIHLPLLVLQPFCTFLALFLFWVYWILVLLFLGTTGNPEKNEQTGLTEFRLSGPLQYLIWYHAVGLIWISEFILACQQMTVAGAVVTYYFTRDKNKLPMTPILSSVFRLIRYHLGTVAKGSFIITLVKIPRLILIYIRNQLKGKENACARCMLKACICCLWCLEKCLNYLNQNAYAATAINSTSFCTSARDAFVILVENALRVAAINTVGDFVLFLGKVLIMTCTAFAGVLALNYQRDYTEWVLPLIIVCLFAFLVAHCFLSIFEIVVDVLFLCFAIDTKYNDGTPSKEFYMDKALMEFVENSRRSVAPAERGRSSKRSRAREEAGLTEMKAMVSVSVTPADCEWEVLQEFLLYYLLLCVLVDWVLSEYMLIICFSQDFIIFICVCLPILTLFLLLTLLQNTPSMATC
ncbi:choline transporter-like protein 1 isoform X5 [Ictalurus furcatus]|uniref:choline transporter-like protein 1 isoform X5 n=1 Tax=Ictalurus furcatus TaxID=66913 RepID=UPI002350561F|nr:choline transporter-like protein 1 isoform X5 [Ictalurus furcatus]